jgi:hypothetical protein
LTDDEYQARRKKLFTERTRVLKAAYDRKMDRLKQQTGGAVGNLLGRETSRMLNIYKYCFLYFLFL